VRDGDATLHAGGRLRLARQCVGDDLLGVAGAAGGGQDGGQAAHDAVLVGAQVGVEADQVGGDQRAHR
jgi:hypothetical protein